MALASGFGFDSETIIYFCVYFDALDGDINGTIYPYFSEIF
ncbi:glycoside hydrolase domain-containing protein [Clostridium estertheticum]